MGLMWSDIGDDSLQIRRALQRQRGGTGLVLTEPKTAQSVRRVYLNDVATTALEMRRSQQEWEHRRAGTDWQDSGLVFTTITGGPMAPDRINWYLNKDLNKAGLPHVRVHDLRHTAATLMREQDVAIEVVGKVLGHSRASTALNIYSHVNETRARDGAEAMNRLFARQDSTG
jgi:integrase